MSAKRYEIGDRVRATVGGTGYPLPGVVTGVFDTPGIDVPPFGSRQYLVWFDGSRGPSGPCVVHRAEDEPEAVSPLSETAA